MALPVFQFPGPTWFPGFRIEVVVAAGALLAIYLVFRARGDLPEAMGFTRSDVALVTLGAVAGQALTIPVFPVDGSLFGINLGGVVVPLIIVGRLIKRGTLGILTTTIGTLAVAITVYPFVVVEPGVGAVVATPWFLLPAGVAVAAGMVLGLAEPIRAGPLAFASGSLGALIGADVARLPEFIQVAREATEGTALVAGGGGVFDLVFLSGALGLALSLGLAMFTDPEPVRQVIGDPSRPPRRVRQARRILRHAEELPGLTARERCMTELARANQALDSEDTAQAVRSSHAAIQALTSSGTPSLADRIEAHGHPTVQADLAELGHRFHRASRVDPGWVRAADTVEMAKHLAGALWDHAPGTVRFEGESA